MSQHSASKDTLRIGELAARTGVSVRSIRYYEQQGLLSAQRTASGYRSFDESAVVRVAHIQELIAAGLCSSKIAELLPYIGGSAATIAPSPDLLDELLRARHRIDGQIQDLQAARTVLHALIEATRTGAAADLVSSRRQAARGARGSMGHRVVPPSVTCLGP